jgi:predicted RNA-binding Zn-ribbon protein involved in translation (DUF1610 family)
MRHVTLFILPGASLMKITLLDDGVRVRCPGCGNEQEYRGKGHREFRHEDRCSVYARIERAMDIYGRDEVKRG